MIPQVPIFTYCDLAFSCVSMHLAEHCFLGHHQSCLWQVPVVLKKNVSLKLNLQDLKFQSSEKLVSYRISFADANDAFGHVLKSKRV